jgi:hypothetical protein
MAMKVTAMAFTWTKVVAVAYAMVLGCNVVEALCAGLRRFTMHEKEHQIALEPERKFDCTHLI